MSFGRVWILAALFAACTVAQTAPGLAGDDRAYVVYGPIVPPKNCSARLAHPVRLESLASNPTRYLGRCLRISGLLIGRTLFTDVDGYYLRGAYESDSFHSGEDRFHIGLYMDDPLAEKIQTAQAFQTTVIGVAGSCEQLWGPNVMMLIGTCHYAGGAILAAASLTPVPLLRLTGESARIRVGNMHVAPADWPERATVTAFANRWLHDIESGDAADYGIVNGSDQYPDTADLVFHDIPSPFETFRGTSIQPQLEIFLTHDQPPHHPDELHRVTISCFCRIADCTGRWPISTMDAANAPQRPYVCMTLYREKDRDTAETETDGRHVEEPPAP
jgi:hypothetical protein